MKKKLLAVVLTIAVVASLLTGCSLGQLSAEDIITKSQEADNSNYRMEGDIGFSLNVAADGEDQDGMSIDVPISISFDAEVADGETHGEADMKMSFMGEKATTGMEFYIDGDTRYICQDGGEWVHSKTDDDFSMRGAMSADCFADAEVVYDKDKGTYTITNTLDKLLENKAFRSAMQDAIEASGDSLNSVDSDDLLDGLADGKITLVFDCKTFAMLRCSLEEITVEVPMEQDGVKLTLSLELEMDIKFSDFGEVDEDDVRVPKSVKNSAVDAIDDSDFGLGLDMGIKEPAIEDPAAPSVAEPTQPAVTVPMQSGADVLGSINGVALVNGCGSWDSTFGADGWQLDVDSDGKYIFVTASNVKYPDADLYVYSKKNVEDFMVNSTIADIKDTGFYGYSVDVAYSSNKANMTWNGLTFGASAEDIAAAYGAPAFTYEGTLYNSYQYDIGEDIELTFNVFGESGLQEVECSIY